LSSWMTRPQGNSESAFIIANASGGLETTHFSDLGHLFAGRLPVFGGRWTHGSNAGVFRLDVSHHASYDHSFVGGRLMFL